MRRLIITITLVALLILPSNSYGVHCSGVGAESYEATTEYRTTTYKPTGVIGGWRFTGIKSPVVIQNVDRAGIWQRTVAWTTAQTFVRDEKCYPSWWRRFWGIDGSRGRRVKGIGPDNGAAFAEAQHKVGFSATQPPAALPPATGPFVTVHSAEPLRAFQEAGAELEIPALIANADNDLESVSRIIGIQYAAAADEFTDVISALATPIDDPRNMASTFHGHLSRVQSAMIDVSDQLLLPEVSDIEPFGLLATALRNLANDYSQLGDPADAYTTNGVHLVHAADLLEDAVVQLSVDIYEGEDKSLASRDFVFDLYAVGEEFSEFSSSTAAGLSVPDFGIRSDGSPDDAQTSIGYDPMTGEVFVDPPSGTQLVSINIDSADGIFTGAAAQNLVGGLDHDKDHNIFKATINGSFGSFTFGNVAQTGLQQEYLLTDLAVVGAITGGRGLGSVDLIYVPEPSTMLLVIPSALVFAFWRRR